MKISKLSEAQKYELEKKFKRFKRAWIKKNVKPGKGFTLDKCKEEFFRKHNIEL